VASLSDSTWWVRIACALTTMALRVVVLIFDLRLPPVNR
jgi:hypothetical protein